MLKADMRELVERKLVTYHNWDYDMCRPYSDSDLLDKLLDCYILEDKYLEALITSA